jgi:membrane protein YqaA with SNARE-associated domain
MPRSTKERPAPCEFLQLSGIALPLGNHTYKTNTKLYNVTARCMKFDFFYSYSAWYNRCHMDETKRKKPFHHKVRDWFKKHYLALLGLLLTLGIIAAVSVVYFKNPNIFEELKGYGYAGVFVASVFMNATLIIPVSFMAILMAMAVVLPYPIIVGLVGGIGAGIGEMTGWLAGRSGRGLISKTNIYTKVEKWVIKWGWIAIFVLSMFPLFFDVAGIIAGAMRMPAWKFFLACWLGRTITYVTVAYLASIGIHALPWLND